MLDFFEHQAAAKRKSTLLVLLYLISVCLIVSGVYFVFVGILYGGEFWLRESVGRSPSDPGSLGPGVSYLSQTEPSFLGSHSIWHPELFGWITLLVLLLVVGSTVYKIVQLAQGGARVAEMLGGRLIQPNTGDADERKILNVVEEMAIASGTPVPPVYLMEAEQGINAFAAGYDPTDAVVGVTRGAVKLLSRDELQGVMAHEFSHILNGDMRLNIRLLGVLHGLVSMSVAGYWLVRLSSGRVRRVYSRNRGGGAQGLMIALGLTLMALGFIGILFSRLMKSAVSRQREYLADASAVQFTRNPEGIAGALKKIGGYFSGSKVEHPQAEEASHLFFSNALKSSWVGLFATHPPLVDRIRRIEPTFKGDFPAVSLDSSGTHDSDAAGVSRMAAGFSQPPGSDSIKVTPEAVVKQVGVPTVQHLNFATGFWRSVSEEIREALREPFSAQAVVYGLLIDSSAEQEKEQLSLLARNADGNLLRLLLRLLPQIRSVNDRYKLAVVDIAIPSLKLLSRAQYAAFRDNVERLVLADRRYTLFEYALLRVLSRHLDPLHAKLKHSRKGGKSIENLKDEVAVILSALAYAGHADVKEAATAYRVASKLVGIEVEFLPQNRCVLQAVDGALDLLLGLKDPDKARLIAAATASVAHDGEVTVLEAELLRAVCDSLACPLPPLLNVSNA